MEEATSRVVVYETRQFEVFSSQPIPIVLLKTIEEIKADNARVNKRVDKPYLMFQLILSRLPPPPPPP